MTPNQWERLKSTFEMFSKSIENADYDADLHDLIAHVEGRSGRNGMVPVDESPLKNPLIAQEEAAIPEVIHIKASPFRSTYCGKRELRGVPVDWPKGHTWVYREDAQVATCECCKDAYERERHEQEV